MILQNAYSKKHKSGKSAPPPYVYQVDNDYFKKWAEFIYGKYASNTCLFPFQAAKGANMFEVEQHSRGNIPISKYQALINHKDPKTNANLWKINWKPISIISTQVEKIRGVFSGVRMSTKISANDSVSTEQRKTIEAASRLQSNSRFQETINSVGVAPTELQGVTLPKEADVDVMVKLNQVRSEIEISLEDLLDSTIDFNNFEDTIKPLMVDDICKFQSCVLKVEPTSSGRIKVKHVDPKRFICDRSYAIDGSDLSFAAELRPMKIFELREAGLDEAALKKVAKHYRRINKSINYFGDFSSLDSSRVLNEINEFECYVMQYSFVADVAECYVVGINPMTKSRIFNKVSEDYELTEEELLMGYTIDRPIIERVFTANWVIDTDIIFGQRELNHVVRKGEVGNKKARLPYVVSNFPKLSIVERAMNYEDDFNIALMKFRKAIQSLPTSSMGVDLALMANSLTVGGTEYSVFELMEIYRATGEYYYMSENEHGIPNVGANRPPVHPINSVDMNRVNIFLSEMNRAYQGILDTMGITQMDTMSDPNERMSVFTGDGQVSNNSLKNIAQQLKTSLKGLSMSIIDYLLEMADSGELDYDAPESIKESSADSLGIEVSIVDIQSVKMEFAGIVNAKYQEGLLSESDKFTIANLIEDGKIQMAEFLLAISVEKARANIQENQQKNIILQSQQAEKAAMVKLQTESKMKEMEHTFNMQSKHVETNGKIAIEKTKHENKMKELEFLEQNQMKDYRR